MKHRVLTVVLIAFPVKLGDKILYAAIRPVEFISRRISAEPHHTFSTGG